MLKINGVAVKTPSSFTLNINDIDGSSERNAKGDLYRDRLAVKRKMELQWDGLTDAEISTLLKAMKDVFFTVEYPDAMEGKLVTKTFYVGDRSAPMYSYKKKLWENLSCSFIEK